MKKIVSIFLALLISTVHAQEVITVVNAQGPSQGMTPQIFKVLDEANKIQNKYKFIQEFKQGAFESIGVRYMLESPANRIVTITNSVVEAEYRGLVDLNLLTPIFSHGSACWVLIANFGNSDVGLASLKTNPPKELSIGGPAIGGAAHLMALEIGKQYNIPVRYILFRGGADALIHMAGDHEGVNLTTDRIAGYQGLQQKNPKLQALGISCPERHKAVPTVKTLTEQKINAPYIFQFTMASNNMPEITRNEIEQILKQATLNIGKEKMMEYSDFISPVFYNQSSKQHYYDSISILKSSREKYKKEIEESGR